MSTEPSSIDDADAAVAELRRLRAENEALNEQVKLLVQIEQRLYRSQNARDQEFERIRALSTFALSISVVTEPRIVIAGALALLRDCFSLELAAAVSWNESCSVAVCTGETGGARALQLDASECAALRGLDHLELAERSELAAPLQRVFAQLHRSSGASRCMILPVQLSPVALFASSAIRKRPQYRDDQLAEPHRAFLELLGTHVRRAIQHAALTADLQARSHRLGELNEQLGESLQRLERTQAQLIESSKMEAIGRLAGGVAHDFNNLLTVILNHAELAAASQAPGSVEAEDLGYVMDAGRRAAEITSQLLTLGRKQPRRGQHLELWAIAEDLGRILRSLLRRGITLEIEADPACAIYADRTQIEQVIMNLALNARDAMPDGGVVRVRIRHAVAADLVGLGEEVRTTRWVALEVADTGSGMDAHTRTKIFEPFFTTKDIGRGTGLGLAVVYSVVAQSSGHISVHSMVGEGTRVVLLFPAREAPQLEHAGPPSGTPAAVRGARLLVVEDSDAIRRVVLRILRRAGYHVEEAGDGAEALAHLRRAQPFELVLTDLSMPKMGGLELADHLAREQPFMQVVFMTGFSEELAEVTERSPSWPCMTKPFTPAELLSIIAQQLRAGRARLAG